VPTPVGGQLRQAAARDRPQVHRGRHQAVTPWRRPGSWGRRSGPANVTKSAQTGAIPRLARSRSATTTRGTGL